MRGYAWAIDAPMLTAISEISASQASHTQKTMQACKILLDYAATYPTAIIRYHASDTALHINSDAAYLVLPNARTSEGALIWVRSNSVVRGTEFLRFGLTIRHN
jgi:hypothetical protein